MLIYLLFLSINLLLNTFSRSFVINFGLLQWSVIELRLCCWGLSSSKRLWVASEIWIFMGSEVDSIIYAIFSYGNSVIVLIKIGMITIFLKGLSLKHRIIVFTVSPNTEKCGIFNPRTDPMHAPEWIPILILSL